MPWVRPSGRKAKPEPPAHGRFASEATATKARSFSSPSSRAATSAACALRYKSMLCAKISPLFGLLSAERIRSRGPSRQASATRPTAAALTRSSRPLWTPSSGAPRHP